MKPVPTGLLNGNFTVMLGNSEVKAIADAQHIINSIH